MQVLSVIGASLLVLGFFSVIDIVRYIPKLYGAVLLVIGSLVWILGLALL